MLSKWNASALVFILVAASVCLVDMFNALVHGQAPALLRDLALMAFTFFYTNSKGQLPPSGNGGL